MDKMKKELLIKELCARLPYRLKCSFGVDDAIYEITGINPGACGASEIQATHTKSSINGDFKLNSCKPYLFPLSSMTEEQKEEYCNLCAEDIISGLYYNTPESIDWLNKNHFDYRGLIEKSLALDATNLGIYE